MYLKRYPNGKIHFNLCAAELVDQLISVLQVHAEILRTYHGYNCLVMKAENFLELEICRD